MELIFALLVVPAVIALSVQQICYQQYLAEKGAGLEPCAVA